MTSEQRKKQLTALFGVYDKRLEKLYDNYIRKMTQLAKQAGIDTEDYISKEGLFRFEKYPELNAEFKSIFDDYVRDNLLNYKSAITSGVTLAFSHQISALSGFSILSDKAISLVRDNAAQTFLRSRLNAKQGLNLSQLVWNYAQQGKSEFEVSVSNVISDGLKKGTSAEELGRKIREYLNNPDMMYRRYHRTVVDVGGNKKDEVTWRRKVKDEEGKTRFVEEPLENVGSGHYRSSRKNATRLMRTEINMAYLRANWERWQKEPFVTGIHIHLSPQHPDHDECDELEGYYPKDFLFIGWHPQCYSDDTKVLTDSGWKLFKDVEIADKILSLNPETRNVKYIGIKERQKWEKNGDMIHFFNRNTDCLVTPEHRMVYLNKSDGRIKYCNAKEYRKGLGGFYRGCIYEGERRDSITIGNTVINFDLFCEFMGYYLSDGSLVRTHQIVISQQEGQPYKQDMITCINRMGFRTKVDNAFISFYSGDLCKYLRGFGRCNQKYIPEEIKNSSKEQIEIFLSAFAKCDGTIKKAHPFVGSHGNICLPNSGERMFFTTSQRMAGDISELLLKIGHRPSIREVQPRDSVKKDGTIIHSNYICYKISDCKSQTTTVFDKEIIKYKGYVYDLTLERNHIMYVQRNGRCYWGSNCMCTSDPITIYGDEKKAFYRRMAQGEDMSNYVSPNAIKDVPDNFKKFIQDNKSKFISAGERGKLGYVWKENLKYVRPQLSTSEQAQMGILPNKVKQKHIKTEEEKADIRRRWNERKEINNARLLLKELSDYPDLDSSGIVKKTLTNAIDSREIQRIKDAIQAVKPVLSFEKSITPDILLDSVMRKKYGDEAVEQLYSNVKRTISNKVSGSIEERINKLRFEADWVLKNRSFATVKEVAAYYEREAVKLEAQRDFTGVIKDIRALETKLSPYNIKSVLTGDEWYGDIKDLKSKLSNLQKYETKIDRLTALEDFSKTSKSPFIKSHIESIKLSLQQYGLNANIEQLLSEAERKMKSLEAEAKARARKVEAEKLKQLIGTNVTADDLVKALGNDCPETIRNLQSVIDSYEKALEGKYTQEEITRFKVGMKQMFAKFDYGMNIEAQYLENCIDEYFKNLIEVGHGNGSTYIPGRVNAAKNMFGFGDINKGKLMEKYGSLLDHDMKETFKVRGASSYGECVVRFKKDKVITTWTIGDSLGLGYQPSLTTDPKLGSLSRNFKLDIPDFTNINTVKDLREKIGYTSYIELQYHGMLTFDCVESVCFNTLENANNYKHLIPRMKKLGVKVYYYDKAADIVVEL